VNRLFWALAAGLLLGAAADNEAPRPPRREPETRPKPPRALLDEAERRVDAGDYDGANELVKPFGLVYYRPEKGIPSATAPDPRPRPMNEAQRRAAEKRARRLAKRAGGAP
jgi:hypothetical protein